MSAPQSSMQVIRSLWFLGFLLISLFAQAAEASSTEDSPSAPAEPEVATRMDLLDDLRRIQNFDRLLYRVVEEREPAQLLLVDDNGQVDVPLIGLVPAKGLTCRALAAALKSRLEVDYFHRATVLVEYQFADNTRGKVNLVGRVMRPGPIPIPMDDVLTVSGAILRTGGFLTGANRTAVQLIRTDAANPEAVQKFTINVADILDKGNLAADMLVKPDDTILVPEGAAAGGTYYVTGSVNTPGEFPFPDSNKGFTVSQAILRAGGFAKFANRDEVLVIRADPNKPGDPKRIKVNVREILEEGRRSNDLELKPDDIVRVREVWFTIQ